MFKKSFTLSLNIILATILSIILGCAANEEGADDAYTITTTVTPQILEITQSQSASFIVDISENSSKNITVAGYNIDLPESVANIDITTSSCPQGVGSASCQEWTISPNIDAIPGTYVIDIAASSPDQNASIISTFLELRVIANIALKSAPAAIAISGVSGVHHVLTRDKKKWSWSQDQRSSNTDGAVGVGGYQDSFEDVMPVSVYVAATTNSSTNFKMIDGSRNHGIALSEEGVVYTWGSAGNHLGYNSNTGQLTPRNVAGIENVNHVTNSLEASFAIRNGEVLVWGSNEYGLHGIGNTDNIIDTTISTAQQLTNAVEISAGNHHVIALTSTGLVFSWGQNELGQLGHGTTDDLPTPTQIAGLSNITKISAAGNFSIALRGDGTVWSWGGNHDQQLGIGSTQLSINTPQQVTGFERATDISAVNELFTTSSAYVISEETIDSQPIPTLWKWGNGISRPEQITTLLEFPRSIGGGFMISANCGSTTFADGSFKFAGFLWDVRGPNDQIARLVPYFGRDDESCPNKLYLYSGPNGAVTGLPLPDVFNEYDQPTEVILTVRANPGWQVDPIQPWEGDEDCNDGMVTVKGGMQCIARFIPLNSKQLNIQLAGNGAGTVLSIPSGIDCGSTCTSTFETGATISLEPIAGENSEFTGWSGNANCSANVQDNIAEFSLTEDTSCTATFSLSTANLSVSKVGSGDGTVISDISGIDCGTDCEVSLDINTQVILTATPDASSTFASWSGTGDCQSPTTLVDNSVTITVSQDSECVATFDPIATGDFVLTVIINGGPGAGEVNSSETPIPLMQCLNSAEATTTCSVPYAADSGVTLVTSLFSPNNSFNVTGCDSFTGAMFDCFVTMDQNKMVTFNIEQAPEYEISSSITGNGSIISFASGAEVGVTGRIDCPNVNCDETFVVPSGAPTAVAFEAHPDTGSTFVSWGVGQCDSEQVINGVGICTIDLVPNSPAVRQVDATFQ